MTKHVHADLLIAIAEGRQMLIVEPNGRYITTETADRALTMIAYGHGDRVQIMPEPRVARRWWANVYDNLSTINNRSGYLYDTKEIADTKASIHRLECIEVIEILPEEDAT